MLSNQLNLKLQPSKYYLIVSALVYGLCLILPWWRLDNLWANITITLFIAFSAITFFPKYVLLSKGTSVTSVTLKEGNASFGTRNGETHLQGERSVSYQSRSLVIIRFGKTYVPIFKDSVRENNLSFLNRFINVS